MTPEEEAALTPETKAERIEGSKWVLVSEQAMVMSVWSCKVIMLILYRTLTYVDAQPINIKDRTRADLGKYWS